MDHVGEEADEVPVVGVHEVEAGGRTGRSRPSGRQLGQSARARIVAISSARRANPEKLMVPLGRVHSLTRRVRTSSGVSVDLSILIAPARRSMERWLT